MTQKNLEYFFEKLQKIFPNAKTELNYTTPFQLLTAVVLSAQSTDKQVNKITSKLFEKIKIPADILKMWQTTLTKNISSINYYKNKAKYIFQTSQILSKNKIYQDFNQDAPIKTKLTNKVSIFDLMKLPWVWEKTAKVVLHVLYDEPVIAVDTHVFRVVNRIWLVKTKTPLATSKILEKKIPDKFKSIAHHCIILFGRYVCKAKIPECKTCPFVKFCKFYSVKLQAK